MSTFKSVDEARGFFVGDKFATNNGMVIDEIGDDYAICSMDIEEGHLNAAGGVMGGVIYTLADFAFAVASNNMHKVTVAITCNINYLSGSKGERLFAKAKCVKDGRTTSVFAVDVTDDLGKEIARFTGTGFKL